MTTRQAKLDQLLSRRVLGMDASGIRRAFELGARLENPINLSIGQPNYPVPELMKEAAITAIREDRNGYSLSGGIDALLDVIRKHLHLDLGWPADDPETSVIVTSGTSGALLLSAMALVDPGDEIIIPDPWFVIYPQLGPLTGAKVVPCDTYPDFRMTADRIEPLITDRTKVVLLNSPGNPTGVVLEDDEVRKVAALCREREVQLVSDEIYDEFVFPGAARADGTCPSPGRFDHGTLLIRGFGKTYGCTGWRLGYAAGPNWLIDQMRKLQQFTFVCAPITRPRKLRNRSLPTRRFASRTIGENMPFFAVPIMTAAWTGGARRMAVVTPRFGRGANADAAAQTSVSLMRAIF